MEFRELLAFPSYKQARKTEILLGECRHKGHCGLESGVSGGSEISNLDQLRPSVISDMDPRNWLKQFEMFMAQTGSYFSLVALIIFSGQALMYRRLLRSESTMMVWSRLLWPRGLCKRRRADEDPSYLRCPSGRPPCNPDERYEMIPRSHGVENLTSRGDTVPKLSGGKIGDRDPILAV